MEVTNADFSGWATMNDVECTDGLTIRRDSFKHDDGAKVPLVYQHQHTEIENVLGHAILENRPEGVYAYGFFNDSVKGQAAKAAVLHGDLDSLSIFANGLKKKAMNVMHGVIREVSLVLAGANPGAKIDFVRLVHSDQLDDFTILEDEAVITFDTKIELRHANDGEDVADNKDKTAEDVYNTLNPEQKLLFAGVVGSLMPETVDEEPVAHSADDNDNDDTEDSLEHSDEAEGSSNEDESSDEQSTSDDESLEHNDKEGGEMTRNVFDQSDKANATEGDSLRHGISVEKMEGFVQAVAADMIRGNMKLQDAMLAHGEDYGITNPELLFPDAKAVDDMPEWITRKMEWVSKVLTGTRHQPFARIKSRSADLTHDEARAKGYIKGNLKKEQFFTIAKRETTPTTVYKKQKMDRDDLIDIKDFDVVTWIWGEMRFMLDEEIARAVLLGDGREVDDDDKIDGTKIRPIAMDDTFYTDVVILGANATSDDLSEAVLRQRKAYRGSGNPTAFIGEDLLADLILEKDKLNRRIYNNIGELATALRVKEIVTCPPLDETVQRDEGEVMMVLVNLSDYTIGTDRGGDISKFTDFDIDYNQEKYLIEGRMSGALVKHKTAQVFVRASGTLIDVTNIVPSFADPDITIPTVTGVTYYRVVIDGPDVAVSGTVSVPSGSSYEIKAVADEGYYLPYNFDNDWVYTAA